MDLDGKTSSDNKRGRETFVLLKDPLSKANRSLKLETQAIEKAVKLARCGELRLRGRKRKRQTTRRKRSLLVLLEPMANVATTTSLEPRPGWRLWLWFRLDKGLDDWVKGSRMKTAVFVKASAGRWWF